MDRLARNAMLAKQAGMSYGKWKAMQPRVEKPAIPDGWKTCEYCGKPYKPAKGKRFCDVVCREAAYKERKAAKMTQEE